MLLGSAVNKTRCSDPWQRREGSRLQSPYIGAEISAKRRSPQFWQLVRPARAEAFSAIQDSQSRRHKNLPGKWDAVLYRQFPQVVQMWSSASRLSQILRNSL